MLILLLLTQLPMLLVIMRLLLTQLLILLPTQPSLDILLDMVLPLDMELVLDMVLSLDMELVLDMVLSLDMDLVLDMVLPTLDRKLMELFKILFILGHNHSYEHQGLKYRKSAFIKKKN